MSTAALAPDVHTQHAALWCRRGSPPRMQEMHRHDDLEINLVLSGELHYLFAGRPLVVREGQVALFWAAQPHGLLDAEAGDVVWVHVPMATVLGWHLPDRLLRPLVDVQPLVVDAGALGPRLEVMVTAWLEDYTDAEGASIALLEIEAAVRRVLRATDVTARATTEADATTGAPAPTDVTAGTTAATALSATATAQGDGATSGRARQAVTMARFVVAHFRDAVAVDDVARAAHLTPSHAMTVFRRAVGVTIGEYLTMCRVAEAQRLLLTTDLGSTEVATASGFGSLSSYYAHVTAACGMAPRLYRRQGRR